MGQSAQKESRSPIILSRRAKAGIDEVGKVIYRIPEKPKPGSRRPSQGGILYAGGRG